MRTLLPALMMLTGCDDVGLDPHAAALIGPILEVAPAGDIAFGGASFEGGSSTQMLSLLSTGDKDLVVLDVYYDEETPLAFSMDNDLPLPLKLPPGEEFPVMLRFTPEEIGSFNGWVLVVVEAADGSERELSRRVIGQGCDPDYAEGECS